VTTSLLLMLAGSLPSPGETVEMSPFQQALTHPPGYVQQYAYAETEQGPELAPQQTLPFPSSMPLTAPPTQINTYYPPTFGNDAGQGMPGDPFLNPSAPMSPGPIMPDPWMGGGTVPPYAAPAPQMMQGPMYTFGAHGPQPHRFGWTTRMDFSVMPSAKAKTPAVGNMKFFGIDLEKEYTTPVGFNWIFSAAPQFNYRSLAGPVGALPAGNPMTDLPEEAYRFGLGLKLQSPTMYGWTYEVGFNPSIGSDLRSSLTSDAYMWDGHVVAFYRTSPQWMWAFGAAYWDRVDDIFIPYAGAVWTPDSVWEFRLLFPKPRVSVFLGNPFNVATWMYVGGEFNVEAYEMSPELLGTKTRVQFRDWRVVGGFRWQTSWVTSFLEAGWILGRDVEFDTGGADFDITSGFIGRVGFRY
jgi:hypothetical protein